MQNTVVGTEYTTDDIEALLAQAYESEERQLRFPKDTYYFSGDAISEAAHFHLSGVEHFTLDGRGSTFIFPGEGIPFLLENCSDIRLCNFNCQTATPESAVCVSGTKESAHAENPIRLTNVRFAAPNGHGVDLQNQSCWFSCCSFSTHLEAISLRADSPEGATQMPVGLEIDRCSFLHCADAPCALAQINAIPVGKAQSGHCFSHVILSNCFFQGGKDIALSAHRANLVQLTDNMVRPLSQRDYFDVSDYGFFQRYTHLHTCGSGGTDRCVRKNKAV